MILNLNELYRKYNMNITGVIHVGAHFGEEHNIYKSLDINNIIYFEPVKKTFNKLKEKIGDNAILFNHALGNENKEVEMYVEEADTYGCSSVLKPSDNYKNVKFNYGEIVKMKRLDDIEFDFSDYNFMNIDVQGYELEVLKGSVETLKHIDYIMCEINKFTLEKPLEYINCVEISDLVEFLSSIGFKLVEENWMGISWGDGFFIKK
jgi:FkbM family methyltransferase